MHVIKNVFDNIIGILLDMSRKMKDGLKSHNDLVQFGLRLELHPILRPNQWRRARYGLIWPTPYLPSKKNHTIALLFALVSTVQNHVGHTLDLLRPPPLDPMESITYPQLATH
jgi:hypothetical protein